MRKTGWGQLALALFSARIFSEATALPDTDIIYGMQRYSVIILSFVLTAVLYIPLYIISRKNDGSFIDIAVSKNKAVAVIFGIVWIAAILISMSETALRAYYYTTSTIFEASPSPLMFVIISAVVIYALFKGTEATVRTGVIVSAAFILLLILVLVSLFSEIETKHLYLSVLDRPTTFFGEVLREFSKNSELLIYAVLCGGVREKAHRSIVTYLSVSCGALLLMTFMYNTILGEYMESVNFPFYTLASISDISVFQRLNGIDTIVWTSAAIIKLSLFALSVKTLIEKCFGNENAAYICATVSVLASSGLSLFFADELSAFGVILLIKETSLPLIIVGGIIPLAALIMSVVKKKRRISLEEN